MGNICQKSFFLLALLGAGVAHAQIAGVVTLRANQTSAQGSLVPVLTWYTNPTAQSCRASGGWSGDKAVSGTQTLSSINASTNYTLTCSWTSGGRATLTWATPTRNTDGTPLTDLAGFKVLYGTSSTALTQLQTVNDPRQTSTIVEPLGPGTWNFTMRAVTTTQRESENSDLQQKVVASATAAGTVAIAITAAPPTGTLKVTNSSVYDVITTSGTRKLGRKVGNIGPGKPCDSSYRVPTIYYRITNSLVRLDITPRSTDLVARCAIS